MPSSWRPAPLTSDALAESLSQITGSGRFWRSTTSRPAAFTVMAHALDMGKLFRQSRYEDAGGQVGDYLNAPFSREEYEAFIEQLIGADRVIRREFETRDLFQAGPSPSKRSPARASMRLASARSSPSA